jgi:hypothetical protein
MSAFSRVPVAGAIVGVGCHHLPAPVQGGGMPRVVSPVEQNIRDQHLHPTRRAIQAIMADPNLTELEKRVRIQQLMSPSSSNVGEADGGSLLEGDDAPTSRQLCPFDQVPPFVAVHFDVDVLTEQVYERSQLFRNISIMGIGRARRGIVHPFTREVIPWHLAWSHVRTVSPELQAELHRLRTLQGLPLADENPLTTEERAQFDATMLAVQARYVHTFLMLSLFHLYYSRPLFH